MNNVKPTQEKVTIGDSTTVTANGRGMACLATSEGKYLNLEDCLYIPQFDRYIISLGRFPSKGHRIEMTESWIKVWSLKGSLYYLTASPRKEGEDEKGDSEIMQVIQKVGKVEVNDAHVLLGHIGKMLLEKNAKLIGWELTGTLTTCDAYAKACLLYTSPSPRD